jgi:hypothetical protein
MSDLAEAIISERDSLIVMLMQTAAARETAPEAASDMRYGVAADSIKAIAATLDMVTDDTLLRLASVNTLSDGLLARLITDRLLALGFEIAPCADALAFFIPIEAHGVEAILAKMRQRLN